MSWIKQRGVTYIRAKKGLLPIHCTHHISYPFAVHRKPNIDAKTVYKKGKWVITHLPSGHSIGHDRRLLKNAKALADKLRQWNEFYLVDPNTALTYETRTEIMKVLNAKHLD
tara:strand:- start:140 stop:475 length:336 start_codon:yes stop_codon:yes gene_type:complete